MRCVLFASLEMCSKEKFSAQTGGANTEVSEGLAAESRVRDAIGVDDYLLRSLGSYMSARHRSFISPMCVGDSNETRVVYTNVCDVSLVH